MFDNNVLCEGSCANVVEDGRITGYEMQTLITYYRGIPLSMLEYVHVTADGVQENDDDIRVSLDYKDWFTLKESETVTSYKWEYGEPLYVRVVKDGGLSGGRHQIKLTVATRTAYIPVPLEGSRECTVEVA